MWYGVEPQGVPPLFGVELLVNLFIDDVPPLHFGIDGLAKCVFSNNYGEMHHSIITTFVIPFTASGVFQYYFGTLPCLKVVGGVVF